MIEPVVEWKWPSRSKESMDVDINGCQSDGAEHHVKNLYGKERSAEFVKKMLERNVESPASCCFPIRNQWRERSLV